MGIRATLSGLFRTNGDQDDSRIGEANPDDRVREGLRRLIRLMGNEPTKARVELLYDALERDRASDENGYKAWVSALTQLAEGPPLSTRAQMKDSFKQVMDSFKQDRKLVREEAEARHNSTVSPQSGAELPKRGGPS